MSEKKKSLDRHNGYARMDGLAATLGVSRASVEYLLTSMGEIDSAYLHGRYFLESEVLPLLREAMEAMPRGAYSRER